MKNQKNKLAWLIKNRSRKTLSELKGAFFEKKIQFQKLSSALLYLNWKPFTKKMFQTGWSLVFGFDARYFLATISFCFFVSLRTKYGKDYFIASIETNLPALSKHPAQQMAWQTFDAFLVNTILESKNVPTNSCNPEGRVVPLHPTSSLKDTSKKKAENLALANPPLSFNLFSDVLWVENYFPPSWAARNFVFIVNTTTTDSLQPVFIDDFMGFVPEQVAVKHPSFFCPSDSTERGRPFGALRELEVYKPASLKQKQVQGYFFHSSEASLLLQPEGSTSTNFSEECVLLEDLDEFSTKLSQTVPTKGPFVPPGTKRFRPDASLPATSLTPEGTSLTPEGTSLTPEGTSLTREGTSLTPEGTSSNPSEKSSSFFLIGGKRQPLCFSEEIFFPPMYPVPTPATQIGNRPPIGTEVSEGQGPSRMAAVQATGFNPYDLGDQTEGLFHTPRSLLGVVPRETKISEADSSEREVEVFSGDSAIGDFTNNVETSLPLRGRRKGVATPSFGALRAFGASLSEGAEEGGDYKSETIKFVSSNFQYPLNWNNSAVKPPTKTPYYVGVVADSRVTKKQDISNDPLEVARRAASDKNKQQAPSCSLAAKLPFKSGGEGAGNETTVVPPGTEPPTVSLVGGTKGCLSGGAGGEAFFGSEGTPPSTLLDGNVGDGLVTRLNFYQQFEHLREKILKCVIATNERESPSYPEINKQPFCEESSSVTQDIKTRSERADENSIFEFLGSEAASLKSKQTEQFDSRVESELFAATKHSFGGPFVAQSVSLPQASLAACIAGEVPKNTKQPHLLMEGSSTLRDIWSYGHLPLVPRKMSGYKYPDMTLREIKKWKLLTVAQPQNRNPWFQKKPPSVPASKNSVGQTTVQEETTAGNGFSSGSRNEFEVFAALRRSSSGPAKQVDLAKANIGRAVFPSERKMEGPPSSEERASGLFHYPRYQICYLGPRHNFGREPIFLKIKIPSNTHALGCQTIPLVPAPKLKCVRNTQTVFHLGVGSSFINEGRSDSVPSGESEKPLFQKGGEGPARKNAIKLTHDASLACYGSGTEGAWEETDIELNNTPAVQKWTHWFISPYNPFTATKQRFEGKNKINYNQKNATPVYLVNPQKIAPSGPGGESVPGDWLFPKGCFATGGHLLPSFINGETGSKNGPTLVRRAGTGPATHPCVAGALLSEVKSSVGRDVFEIQKFVDSLATIPLEKQININPQSGKNLNTRLKNTWFEKKKRVSDRLRNKTTIHFFKPSKLVVIPSSETISLDRALSSTQELDFVNKIQSRFSQIVDRQARVEKIDDSSPKEIAAELPSKTNTIGGPDKLGSVAFLKNGSDHFNFALVANKYWTIEDLKMLFPRHNFEQLPKRDFDQFFRKNFPKVEVRIPQETTIEVPRTFIDYESLYEFFARKSLKGQPQNIKGVSETTPRTSGLLRARGTSGSPPATQGIETTFRSSGSASLARGTQDSFPPLINVVGAKRQNIQISYQFLPASQGLLQSTSAQVRNVSGLPKTSLRPFYKFEKPVTKSLVSMMRSALPVSPKEKRSSPEKKAQGTKGSGTGGWQNRNQPVTKRSRRPQKYRVFEPWQTSFGRISFLLGFSKLLIGLALKQQFQVVFKNYTGEIIDLVKKFDPLLARTLLEEQAEKKAVGRSYKKVNKRLKDIAGIDSLFPQLLEIILWLRHPGRQSSVSGGRLLLAKGPAKQVFPKGILLVGPPGTGKTVLVQALAGEAEVPILAHSGSEFQQISLEDDDTTEQVQDMFKRAKRFAPCILFIDEIDSLGQTRGMFFSNDPGVQRGAKGNKKMSATKKNVDIDSLIGIGHLDSNCFDSPQKEQDTTTLAALPTGRDTLNFLPSQGSAFVAQGAPTITDGGPPRGDLRAEETDFFGLDREGIEINAFESRTKAVQKFNQRLQQTVNSSSELTKTTKIKTLVEFLVQMDGFSSYGQKGIVVIGATNRPGNLDPAFIRPGRFSKIITLELPGKKKRIEILKLYSRNLGIDKTFCSAWDYILNRTAGFSAADLAAVMNQSAIQAILAASRHSVKSFEKGIDLLTTDSIETPFNSTKKYKDPFFLTRQAYYQAGKVVVHTTIPDHPPVIVMSLWPRPSNARQKAQKPFFMTSLQGPPKEGKASSAGIAAPGSHSLMGGSGAASSLFPHYYRRKHLESLMIGFYAGKAAELLLLSCTKLDNKVVALSEEGPDDACLEGSSPEVTQPLLRENIYVAKPKLRPKITVPLWPRRGNEATRGTKGLINYVGTKQVASKNVGTSFLGDKTALWQSDCGSKDLSAASCLAVFMVERAYFFSKKLATRKTHLLVTQQNKHELKHDLLVTGYGFLTDELENEIITRLPTLPYYQNRYLGARWQIQILRHFEILNLIYDDWYRIYLPDSYQNKRNLEWVPPDKYFHGGVATKNLVLTPSNFLGRNIFEVGGSFLKQNPSPRANILPVKCSKEQKNKPTSEEIGIATHWNDMYSLDRDYFYHSVCLASFNKAFLILDKNREIVDYFASYLIRYGIVRQNEIETIFSQLLSEKM